MLSGMRAIGLRRYGMIETWRRNQLLPTLVIKLHYSKRGSETAAINTGLDGQSVVVFRDHRARAIYRIEKA